MPRVTLTFARFTLIAAVGLTVIWTCPPALAAASLVFAQGTEVCDQTSVTTTCDGGSDGMPHLYKQLWKIGTSQTQHEWNYETQSGEGTPLLFANANLPSAGYSGSWTTWGTNVRNEPWQFQIIYHVMHMAPPHTDTVSTSWVTVTPNNTVVTSDGHLLFWDGHTQPAVVSWTTVHKLTSTLAFTVTANVYSLATNQVVRHLTTTQQGAGFDSIPWDGNGDNSSPCPKGVYAYKVTAGHAGGYTGVCFDSDKSTALTLNAPTLSNWAFSVPNMNVTAGLVHSASCAGVNVHWDVYRPDFSVATSGGYSPDQGAPSTEATAFDVNPAGPFGNWTYVLSETENATQAALNRGGAAKPALQRGVAHDIWPYAIATHGGGMGLNQDDEAAFLANLGATDQQSGSHYAASELSPDPVIVLPEPLTAIPGLRTAAVAHLSGHGNPWDIRLGGTDGYGILSSKRDTNANFDVHKLGQDDAKHALLVFYDGCDTWCYLDGETVNGHTVQPNETDYPDQKPTNGLIDTTTGTCGAVAAAGYIGSVNVAQATCFADLLWVHLMADGMTVDAASLQALDELETVFWPFGDGGCGGFMCTQWNLQLKGPQGARWSR